MNPSIQEIEDFLVLMHDTHPSIQSHTIEGRKHHVDDQKMHLLSMIISFKLDLVTVKPSKIHGNGVFAKRDIQKGELLTFYPGDKVNFAPNKDSHIDGHKAFVFWSKRMENKYGHDECINVDLGDYKFDIDDRWIVYGDPSFTDDASYLGHLINDGAKPNDNPKSIQIYCKISKVKANCDFRDLKSLHLAIVATKDISAGEELFISYGVRYWSNRI